MMLTNCSTFWQRLASSVHKNVRTIMTLKSTRSFTQTDVDTFAQISGDKNPIHVDVNSNKYGKPIVHGTLILG